MPMCMGITMVVLGLFFDTRLGWDLIQVHWYRHVVGAEDDTMPGDVVQLVPMYVLTRPNTLIGTGFI